jgi:hypothetical protein
MMQEKRRDKDALDVVRIYVLPEIYFRDGPNQLEL